MEFKPRIVVDPAAVRAKVVNGKKSRKHPGKQIAPSHPVTVPETTLSPPEIGTSPAHTAAFDPRLFLGACPSNAKSAVMATSACGSRNWKSQHMATQLITQTGS